MISLNQPSGGSFASLTGAVADNAALVAALALKLDKAGGTMTGNLTTKAAGLLIPGSVSGTVTLQAPAVAGTPTITFPSVTSTLATLGANQFTGAQILSVNGAASTPSQTLNGTWFTGGSSTTTKPQLLIEPSGTTSTAWSTGGTGIGVNAPSGFAGRLWDFKVNNSSQFYYENSSVIVGSGNSFSVGGLLLVNSANCRFASGVYFGVSSASDASTLADIAWYRDAAGVFSCKNPTTLTNATTLRVYGTFTDASNYVRLALNTTSTTMGIACETLGTGADNIDLTLTPAGTGLVAISNAASTDAALVSTHSARIKFNGTEYKVLLATP